MAYTAAFGANPFSAVVDLWLEKDGERISLTHVEPAIIRAANPQSLPPGPATIFISVDGKIQKHPVYLDDGMSESDPDTLVRPVDSVPF